MMFCEMRRKDRQLSKEDGWAILSACPYGVLSLQGKDGYPYGVPMHFVSDGESLYFHGAKAMGLKTRCIEKNPKTCFSVIEPLGGAQCRSALVFGTLEPVPQLATEVLNRLIEKFVPKEGWAAAKEGISAKATYIAVFRLNIQGITAKIIDKPKEN